MHYKQYIEKQTGLIWQSTWLDEDGFYYLQTENDPIQYWAGKLNELNNLFDEKIEPEMTREEVEKLIARLRGPLTGTPLTRKSDL